MSEKIKKQKYRCDTCGEEFYITIKPNLCPVCGSSNIYKGSKIARDTAGKYIKELYIIIPQMDELTEKLSALYTEYMTIHETLRTYAHRGIIDRDEIPDFVKPNMTEAFYDSRKKRTKTAR